VAPEAEPARPAPFPAAAVTGRAEEAARRAPEPQPQPRPTGEPAEKGLGRLLGGLGTPVYIGIGVVVLILLYLLFT